MVIKLARHTIQLMSSNRYKNEIFSLLFAAKLLLTTGDNGMGYDDPSKTTEILDITMSPLVKPKHCFNSYAFPLSKY